MISSTLKPVSSRTYGSVPCPEALPADPRRHDQLQRRVVLAPMARCRADVQHVPGPLILEYYKQRTSVLGTLAITEATFIDARAGGYTNIPGIWNDEQVAGWKLVRPCSFP